VSNPVEFGTPRAAGRHGVLITKHFSTSSAWARSPHTEAPSYGPRRVQRLVRRGVVQRERQTGPRTQAERAEPESAARVVPEKTLDCGSHIPGVEEGMKDLAGVGDVVRT